MIGNNTIRLKLKARKMKVYPVIFIFLMLVLGSNFLCIIAIGENPETSTHFFIESRFKLWDSSEKMIGESFIIHLLYYNNSNNNTFSYYIQINNEIYNGTENYYLSQEIRLNNGDIINTLTIKINGETVLSESNIRVIGGVSSAGIKRSIESFTISLSPFLWTLKERNIAFSVLTSGIIGVLLGFPIIKIYRSKNGITEIKG